MRGRARVARLPREGRAVSIMVAAGMPAAAAARDPESTVGPGALLFAAAVGLVLVCSACWWGARQIYRNRKSPALWIGAPLALVLGTIGLHFSWVATYRHGDEASDFAAGVLMAFTRFQPMDFAYPPLHATVVGALTALVIVAVSVFTGSTLEHSAVTTLLFHEREVLLLARAVSTAACIGVLALAYRITSNLGGSRVAGLFIVLMILIGFPSPLANLSEWWFWVSPHPLALFLGLLFLAKVLSGDENRPYGRFESMVLGVIFGLGMATHYFMILFAPAYALELMRRWRGVECWRASAVFAASSVIVFSIVNRYLFVNWEHYSHILSRQFGQLAGVERSLWATIGIYLALASLGALLLVGARIFFTRFKQVDGRALAILVSGILSWIVFSVASMHLTWYWVYPATLMSVAMIILAAATVRLRRLPIEAKLAMVVYILVFAAFRFTWPSPVMRVSEHCVEHVSRGTDLVEKIDLLYEGRGEVWYFDNSFFAVSTARMKGVMPEWLGAAAAAVLKERTGLTVRWKNVRPYDREHDEMPAQGEFLYRISWPTLTDYFDEAWVQDLDEVFEHSEQECRMTIYRRR